MKILAYMMLFACVGCAAVPYNTVKTGPQTFSLTGSDPNQLQGNAYKACKDDGFDDYSVVESQKGRMIVRCEKTPKSFGETASETASKAWETVKKKVNDLRETSSSR